MNPRLTLRDLEVRWEKMLTVTRKAAAKHPRIYRELKSQATDIVEQPVDISDYFTAVNSLVSLLETLDPGGKGSVFSVFRARISPTSIWHVKMLRMECKDLLSYLNAFDEWRRNKHNLRMVK